MGGKGWDILKIQVVVTAGRIQTKRSVSFPVTKAYVKAVGNNVFFGKHLAAKKLNF